MKQNKFEEELGVLSKIKSDWESKSKVRFEILKEFMTESDSDKLIDLANKLSELGDELNRIGDSYEQALKKLVEKLKNEVNEPALSKYYKEILSPTDGEYTKYQGDRELRLQELNDLIEMYKAVKNTPTQSIWKK